MRAGGRDDSFNVAWRRQITSLARGDKRILRIAVFIGVALLQSVLVRAQDAAPTILPEPTVLPELSKRTGPEPLTVEASPGPATEKPSIEILAGTPGGKPAPSKHTPPQKHRPPR